MKIEKLKKEQLEIISEMQTFNDDVVECPHCHHCYVPDKSSILKQNKDGSFLVKCEFCHRQYLMGIVISYVGTPTLRQVNNLIKKRKEKENGKNNISGQI